MKTLTFVLPEKTRPLWILFFVSFVLQACVAEKGDLRTRAQRTYFYSELSPTVLLIQSQKFLEWTKGFNIDHRDFNRGILSTDWVQETPLERMRIHIRVSTDPQGSLLSLHMARQVFQSNEWQDAPQVGSSENEMIKELELYVANATRQAPGNP